MHRLGFNWTTEFSANYALYSPVRLIMHRSLVLTLSFGVTTGIARYRDLVVSWSFCILRYGSLCLSLSVSLSASLLSQSLCFTPAVFVPACYFTFLPIYQMKSVHLFLASLFTLFISWCFSSFYLLLLSLFVTSCLSFYILLMSTFYTCCFIFYLQGHCCIVYALVIFTSFVAAPLCLSFLASDVLKVYCIGIPVIMNFTSLRSRPTS